MWSNIATVVGIIAVIVCAVSTLIYVPAVRASRRAYRELLLSEGEAVDGARKQYWALDKRQKRAALTAIACYAVGMLIVMPFGNAENHHHLYPVIALTLLLWTVSGFATFAKSEWQIRMEVEDQKREEQMRKIREARQNR